MDDQPTEDTSQEVVVKDQGQMIISENDPEKAYKVATTDVMDPVIYKQLKVLANDFIKSRAVPQGFANAEQVFVAMMAGREMGMAPYESLQSLYLVNGNLSLWGKAVIRRIRAFGYMIEYTNESDDAVTARVIRGKEDYKETYTFKEAEASGYTKDSRGAIKFGWRAGTNRRLKLRYGALNLILRTYIPDVMGSALGIAEVIEDVNIKSEPNPIDVDLYKGLLEECKDMPGLAKVWSNLPAEAKSNIEIIEFKDAMKEKLGGQSEDN